MSKANPEEKIKLIAQNKKAFHDFEIGEKFSPYSHASFANHDPERIRKLLLHKSEIKKLLGKTQERGFSLVPLRVYFKNGKAKVEIALARGKREFDKRESLKRKEETREMERLRKKHNIS
jgi:SsrA-binding protein